MRLFGLIAAVILIPLLLVFTRPFWGRDVLSDPYRVVTWQDVAAGATLHDEPARITGFMLPPPAGDHPVTGFFLAPSLVTDRTANLPPREQLVWIELESGDMPPTERPISVWGIWESKSIVREGAEASHTFLAHGWEEYRAAMPGEVP